VSFAKEFSKGLWKEIPPFRLVLGLCPTLAVTTSSGNGLGMGLATAFVLTCSNVLISLIRKVVPGEVRIAAYIVVVATFTVIVELLAKAFLFSLSEALGLFIPLIVVNCIVLGRAEAFASKNGVLLSLADGLGIGIGYTAALFTLGSLREIVGAGTWLNGTGWLVNLVAGGGATFNGIRVLPDSIEPLAFLQQPPGAFLCLGSLLGLMNILGTRSRRRGAPAK
jgi:electron transport complex protein RnfE